MSARRASALPAAQLVREAEAIVAGALALFLTLSFVSYAADAPRANLGGPVGHALAGTVLRALGLAAYLFPVALGYCTAALLGRGAEGFGALRLAGGALGVVSVAALAGLATGGRAVLTGGGWLGGFLAVALADLVGGPGAFLVITVALVVALVLATGASAVDTASGAARWAVDETRRRFGRLRRGAPALAEAPARARPGPRPPVLLDEPLDEPPGDEPPDPPRRTIPVTAR